MMDLIPRTEVDEMNSAFFPTLTPVPGSSNIEAHGYDPLKRELRVRFVGGKTFSYPDVPLVEYNAMRNAPSLGSYFAKKIRPKFKGTILEDPI